MINFLRALYRRLRDLPVIGPLVVSLRNGRLMPGGQVSQLQAIVEAQSAAIAGLRDAAAGLTAGQRHLFKAHAELNSGIYSELYKQVDLVNRRVEFVREETMYEMRHLTGSVSHQSSGQQDIEPQVIDSEKLDRQRAENRIRLNVGCGHKPDADRINIDMRPLPGVEIVAQAHALPFSAGEVQEIFSSHVMEHFPQQTLERTLMPHWTGLLASGGELRAIVPDGQAMIDAYVKKEIDFERLRLIFYGGQEYEGDFHHTMFTPETLAALFKKHGLVDVTVEASGRENGLCFECEVVGRKP